jgi:hypothetical protein
MCFNCAGQALSLSPMPRSAAELKEALDRDRRGRDRRVGRPDSRVFRYERRVGERRSLRDDGSPIDDDMIIEITVDLSASDDVDFGDMTQIFSTQPSG